MKHTKPLIAGVIAFALLCSACSVGSGGTAPSNDLAGAGSATEPSQVQPLAVGSNTSSFSDVSDNAVYAPAVAYCLEHGILNGTSATTFEPETITTRAMTATILYRMEGEPSVTGEDSFTDTAPGIWYSNAILWASEQELLQGYGGGVFGTNDPITREQLITVLHRYLGEPLGQGSFSDLMRASSYAQAAIRWAAEAGICQDFAVDEFQPAAPIHRWEMACVLYRTLTTNQNNASGAITTNGGEKVTLTSLAHQSAGAGSTVYYISDISPDALMAIYEALAWTPGSNIAVKLSTGEPGSNYLRTDLIGPLVQSLDDPTIVECNTAYGGSRANTARHYQVAEDHGYTAIADVDIMDENGSMTLPVTGGTNLRENYVGAHFANYDSFLVLSHFKGHAMAGFGGAIKNISIGIASSQGKSHIHSGGTGGSMWGGDQDAFLESMAEAGKSVVEALDGKIVYINVMNRLSVDCDCDGNPSAPDMHDIGILASYDPVALDQACVDLVYSVQDGRSLINRMESRNGIHTLEHAEVIGLGNRAYQLVNIGSRENAEISR